MVCTNTCTNCKREDLLGSEGGSPNKSKSKEKSVFFLYYSIERNTFSARLTYMKTVAVFGAGIAGLTVAHEFAHRGYAVSVYEANETAGGFFRSARLSEDDGMPSEYSWHGMGPMYHNVFDIMKPIPFDETGSVYEKALSRPIAFGVAPDVGIAQFDDSPIS